MSREALLGYGPTALAFYRNRLMGKLGIGPGRGKRALDLGCGRGQEALYLAGLGYRVEAVDRERHADWKRIEKESRGRVKFSVGDAQALGRVSGRYDLVFEKDMLHHAGDPVAALREMARLAKPGGSVMVAEANRWNPIFYVHLTLMGDHQHFTRRRLLGLLGRSGLGQASLKVAECRVWPVNHAGWLRWIDRAQDLAEALRLLDPFLCYHLAVWRKPGRRSRKA